MAYIDEQKAKRKLQYIFRAYGVSNVIKDKIFKALSDSTADVQEVKHGEWMFNRNQAQNEPLYFCPFCVDGESNSGKDNYCPNCGRKMDGGADNG